MPCVSICRIICLTYKFGTIKNSLIIVIHSLPIRQAGVTGEISDHVWCDQKFFKWCFLFSYVPCDFVSVIGGIFLDSFIWRFTYHSRIVNEEKHVFSVHSVEMCEARLLFHIFFTLFSVMSGCYFRRFMSGRYFISLCEVLSTIFRPARLDA